MAAAVAMAKPVLAHIETSTAKMKAAMSSFPSELSALSAKTPISAHPLSACGPFTAPISPPTAYTEFLKSIALQSPISTRSSPTSPLSTSSQFAPSARPPVFSSAPRPTISITLSDEKRNSAAAATAAESAAATVANTPTVSAFVLSPARARASSASPSLSGKRPLVQAEDESDYDDDSDDDSDTESDTADEDDTGDETRDTAHDDAQDNDTGRNLTRHGAHLLMPMSAPPQPTSFPSLLIPPSPSRSLPAQSPLSATFGPAFSATSPCFPFNLALSSPLNREPSAPAQARDHLHYLSAAAAAATASASASGTRTFRYPSVVTRTVRTVTISPPYINPPPVGRTKRRKVE